MTVTYESTYQTEVNLVYNISSTDCTIQYKLITAIIPRIRF
jgi:hypothetical protein